MSLNLQLEVCSHESSEGKLGTGHILSWIELSDPAKPNARFGKQDSSGKEIFGKVYVQINSLKSGGSIRTVDAFLDIFGIALCSSHTLVLPIITLFVCMT